MILHITTFASLPSSSIYNRKSARLWQRINSTHRKTHAGILPSGCLPAKIIDHRPWIKDYRHQKIKRGGVTIDPEERAAAKPEIIDPIVSMIPKHGCWQRHPRKGQSKRSCRPHSVAPLDQPQLISLNIIHYACDHVIIMLYRTYRSEQITLVNYKF